MRVMMAVCAVVLPLSASAEQSPPGAAASVAAASPAGAEMTLDDFLDRLMQAESGGRADARNSRSTAVGPYQFIASTWLQIARTSFATETAGLKPHQVLDLRTDMTFARRAAKIYTEENAAHLVAHGQKASFANLRLAFLVGAAGAVKVLSAKPDTPVSALLGATVVGANPFMRTLDAEGLIARAARDIASDAQLAMGGGLSPPSDAVAKAKGSIPLRRAEPAIEIDCDLSRPSCRRWVALAKRKASKTRRASRE
jgi:Transglycosylase-like domain